MQKPDLILVNTSSLVADATVAAWLPALQRQIDGDFAPLWGVGGTLRFAGKTRGAAAGWSVILKDAPDDSNDFGFHVDDTGVPEARIFVQPILADGESVAAVLSHELLEMLADPTATRMAPDNRHIVEIADPVQQTRYDIDGVTVSNFVTPAYFGLAGGTRYDFNRQLAGPCDRLLPGGYIMVWTGAQWQSKFARRADGGIGAAALARAARSGRTAWRARHGSPVVRP